MNEAISKLPDNLRGKLLVARLLDRLRGDYFGLTVDQGRGRSE